MKKALLVVATLVAASASSVVNATVFTFTSPTGGTLPTGITEVGGLVLDLTGSNGARVVSQLSASELYVGYADGNPQEIGVQGGFNAGVLAALGGGLQSAAVRVSLFDGDTAAGNFDFNQNTLFLNNVSFGNFSAVQTQQTNALGTVAGTTTNGFRNETLDTGWFSLTDSLLLNTLFGSLAGGSVAYSLLDVDAFDNFYDFTQGVDGSLINVGSAPVVTTPVTVPEPSSLALLGLGLLGVARSIRKSKAAK